MNEKMRKALGFLGLVEDDYNEYAAAEAARPFTDDVRDEPNWAPRQNAPARAAAPAPRINPTPAPRTGPAPLRPQPGPSGLGPRPSSLSLLDAAQPVPRARPVPATSAGIPHGDSGRDPVRSRGGATTH